MSCPLPILGDQPVAVRPIVVLTLSAFVAIAAVRITDPLLPQLAQDFATTPTGASIVSTSAMAAYGVCQIAYGPLGERHGKYTVVAAVTLLGAAFMLASALVQSLEVLAVLRLATGKKGGRVVYRDRRTVSEDGKTLTISRTGTDSQGKAYRGTMVFDKQ